MNYSFKNRDTKAYRRRKAERISCDLFPFFKLEAWNEGAWNFFAKKKKQFLLLNGVRSICLPPLSLYESFTSLFLTPCAPSQSFQSVCLTGIAWRKKGKRKTRRDTQLSSTADWNCKVILKSERRGERKRCSLACLSQSSTVCVAQRRWTKEAALTGERYIAKRLFNLMTSGPPLHHHPIHTAPAVPCCTLCPFIQLPPSPCSPCNSPLLL